MDNWVEIKLFISFFYLHLISLCIYELLFELLIRKDIIIGLKV